MKRITLSALALITVLCLLLSSCSFFGNDSSDDAPISLSEIPEFSGEAYVEINGNEPFFTKEERATVKSFESYSELDELGRCGVTVACVGIDIMPTDDRGSIGQVKPSGWQTVKYDIVDGKYLYNRCHLIGFQLTGENANVKNLITGTRYLNIEGMLPFENLIADYVKEYENHVMYRVTPIYDGYNLVASGVLMEGYSVEDGGEGVSFCVYAYNNQPGIIINYSNGMSRLATEDEWNGKLPEDSESTVVEVPDESDTYKINKSSKKIHDTDCRSAKNLTETCTGDELGALKADGYTQCGTCDPFIEEVWALICGHKDTDSNGFCDDCNVQFKDGSAEVSYVINTNTKKIHLSTCRYAKDPDGVKLVVFEGTKTELLAAYPTEGGYTACGTCHALD